MLKSELFKMQDLKYRDFHAKLMPTVCKDKIIGIRVPQLRKYAKEFFKDDRCHEFLNIIPHTYYEENNLHAFLIEQISDFTACIFETERFLPCIDNWATCDMMRPKIFKSHTKTGAMIFTNHSTFEMLEIFVSENKPQKSHTQTTISH